LLVVHWFFAVCLEFLAADFLAAFFVVFVTAFFRRNALLTARVRYLVRLATIKCNAYPACFALNVTVVIAMLDIDDKFEWTGNADLAFDLEIRAAIRHVADQTVDPGAIAAAPDPIKLSISCRIGGFRRAWIKGLAQRL
jgi:hypothetical protein